MKGILQILWNQIKYCTRITIIEHWISWCVPSVMTRYRENCDTHFRFYSINIFNKRWRLSRRKWIRTIEIEKNTTQINKKSLPPVFFISNKDTKEITLPTVEGKEEKTLADDYGVPLMFYLSMRNRTYLLKCFLV